MSTLGSSGSHSIPSPAKPSLPAPNTVSREAPETSLESVPQIYTVIVPGVRTDAGEASSCVDAAGVGVAVVVRICNALIDVLAEETSKARVAAAPVVATSSGLTAFGASPYLAEPDVRSKIHQLSDFLSVI